MKQTSGFLKSILITFFILSLCFVVCLWIEYVLKESAFIPAVFVLGVFLTSVITKGYIYGIIASLISVLAVNFAFTFPYFALDFKITENIISALIMIVVTMVACAITTKLRRQEVLKAENEKERMRANLLRAVSHDLRTPLATIYGSSSALLENYDDFSEGQRQQMLKGIKEDSQWLSRMVENLLSVTRLDGGNVDIIKTETVLDELVDSVLIKFASRYPEQKVVVDLPDELVVIPMDAILIEQVAINILENAVCHGKGMTEIIFKVFTASGKAVFEISDNGCGIAKDKLKNIFNGTYSSDTVPADGKKHNAGIGLSVCASIIKAHGGTICAKNIKTGGCVFRFALNMEN